MGRKKQTELIGKVYNRDDSPIGEIHLCVNDGTFVYTPKKGTEITSKTINCLTSKAMKQYKFMYIRWVRNKTFNIKDHYKPSVYPNPHWDASMSRP